jgi:hypothetical protein
MSYVDAGIAGMTPSNFIYEIIRKMNLHDANLERGRSKDPQ